MICAEVVSEGSGHVDLPAGEAGAQPPVLRPRLQQQHLTGRVLSQSVCQDAARGAGPHDDSVQVGGGEPSQLPAQHPAKLLSHCRATVLWTGYYTPQYDFIHNTTHKTASGLFQSPA